MLFGSWLLRRQYQSVLVRSGDIHVGRLGAGCLFTDNVCKVGLKRVLLCQIVLQLSFVVKFLFNSIETAWSPMQVSSRNTVKKKLFNISQYAYKRQGQSRIFLFFHNKSDASEIGNEKWPQPIEPYCAQVSLALFVPEVRSFLQCANWIYIWRNIEWQNRFKYS